jgi:RNA polymerase sigma-70 factor (ECF subfamily)
VTDGLSEASAQTARIAAEAAARRSYGKLIACLAAQTRDLAEAEDALAEAFALALETWPRTGGPCPRPAAAAPACRACRAWK